MAKGRKVGKSSKKVEKKKNPLFESTARNFRIGGDIQPKRDLTRFMRIPKYILLQRQKRVLLQRLKVPPAIHQFSTTLDKNQTSAALKLFGKYSPETQEQKRQRLQTEAENKKNNQKTDSKKPIHLKFGLNHITTLVENKLAKLVLIAHDVDPIELVIWLPQLCRANDVPFAFVKGQERLGKLVHQKHTTAVALTDVRPEDNAQLKQFAESFKNQFNENVNLRRTWGGGKLGQKSQHAIDLREAARQKEALKKANM